MFDDNDSSEYTVNPHECADEFRMVARTYGNLANVYTNIYFPDLEKTVVLVYLVDHGERFKHFTFVLPAGKTRVTLTDLTVGKYEVDAIQYAKDGTKGVASVSFKIFPPDGNRDRSERIERDYQ